MIKDTTIEKIIIGGEKVNKSELARQYDCCRRTIDRRLNPEKYKKEKKKSNWELILNKLLELFGERDGRYIEI